MEHNFTKNSRDYYIYQSLRKNNEKTEDEVAKLKLENLEISIGEDNSILNEDNEVPLHKCLVRDIEVQTVMEMIEKEMVIEKKYQTIGIQTDEILKPEDAFYRNVLWTLKYKIDEVLFENLPNDSSYAKEYKSIVTKSEKSPNTESEKILEMLKTLLESNKSKRRNNSSSNIFSTTSTSISISDSTSEEDGSERNSPKTDYGSNNTYSTDEFTANSTDIFSSKNTTIIKDSPLSTSYFKNDNITPFTVVSKNIENGKSIDENQKSNLIDLDMSSDTLINELPTNKTGKMTEDDKENNKPKFSFASFIDKKNIQIKQPLIFGKKIEKKELTIKPEAEEKIERKEIKTIDFNRNLQKNFRKIEKFTRSIIDLVNESFYDDSFPLRKLFRKNLSQVITVVLNAVYNVNGRGKAVDLFKVLIEGTTPIYCRDYVAEYKDGGPMDCLNLTQFNDSDILVCVLIIDGILAQSEVQMVKNEKYSKIYSQILGFLVEFSPNLFQPILVGKLYCKLPLLLPYIPIKKDNYKLFDENDYDLFEGSNEGYWSLLGRRISSNGQLEPADVWLTNILSLVNFYGKLLTNPHWIPFHRNNYHFSINQFIADRHQRSISKKTNDFSDVWRFFAVFINSKEVNAEVGTNILLTMLRTVHETMYARYEKTL
ncbi:hypothetical protein SNEBB_003656 [Seison nebaliae]|nr:hypothetical protein SNEBB_003656 [Seison nebaliae]